HLGGRHADRPGDLHVRGVPRLGRAGVDEGHALARVELLVDLLGGHRRRFHGAVLRTGSFTPAESGHLLAKGIRPGSGVAPVSWPSPPGRNAGKPASIESSGKSVVEPRSHSPETVRSRTYA